MASPISILKNVLNINKNKIHVINIEERTVTYTSHPHICSKRLLHNA